MNLRFVFFQFIRITSRCSELGLQRGGLLDAMYRCRSPGHLRGHGHEAGQSFTPLLATSIFISFLISFPNAIWMRSRSYNLLDRRRQSKSPSPHDPRLYLYYAWSVLSTPARGRGDESAAAAAAALEFPWCYSSGGTVHARHSRRRLGLGNPGSLQDAGNNTCFCLPITDTGFSFYRDD